MLAFFRNLWTRLFGRKTEIVDLPLPTYYAPDLPAREDEKTVDDKTSSAPTVSEKTFTPVFPTGKYDPDLPDKLNRFYGHTKKRMEERYNGFNLTRQQYNVWDDLLQKGELKSFDRDGEHIYYVEYGREVFFFVAKDGHIVTAIPPREKYIIASVGLRDEFREFFECTRLKVREFYGFELTRDLYDKWDMMLRVGTLRRCTTEREVFYVNHNEHVVFLAEKKGHIVTALAPNKTFLRNSIGRTGIKHHTGKVKAKNAGRRNNQYA